MPLGSLQLSVPMFPMGFPSVIFLVFPMVPRMFPGKFSGAIFPVGIKTEK